MDRVFRKYINAHDLQDPGQILVQSGRLVENGHHQVSADCDPDLGLHRVLARAAEGLDAQVLLDPFEEELDLPASLVELRHDCCFEIEVVGEEDQRLSRLRIHIADTPQVRSVQSLGFRAVEPDGLVRSQSGRLVHGSGLLDVEAHVRLRPYHEVGAGRVDAEEASEVEVAAIHHVEGTRLERDPVQGVHVVDLSLGHGDEGWYRAGEIDHCVNLDRGLAASKLRPREQRHAQVDDRSVQGVDRLVDLLDVSFLRTQAPSLSHEDAGELEENTPISLLVDVSEIASGDRPLDAQGVEQLSLRAKARLDVPETLAISQLSEEHAKELVASGETLRSPRHRILGYASVELLAIDDVDDLRENEAA